MYKIIPIIMLLVTSTVSSQTIKTPTGKSIEASEITKWLEEKMKSNGTPGAQLAIINDGEMVFHTAAGYATTDKPVTEDTVFEGASLSKPLFGYFVMKLQEQGLIDLDKPLYEYLPYRDIAHDERYKKITARYVLSHQSGFPNWRDENGKTGLTIDFEPGTDFQYSGEGYQYLALVLQKILNTNAKGLQKRFHKEVAKPFGLKVTRYIQNKRNLKNKAHAFKQGKWYPHRDFGKEEFGAAYGVHSTAADWSKFIIGLISKKGLSPSSYEELFKVQKELPEGSPNKTNGITHLTLGFYGGELPFGTVYGHGGNNDKKFTSLFFFIPDSKMGIVLFTNSSFGEQMGLELLQFMMVGGQ